MRLVQWLRAISRSSAPQALPTRMRKKRFELFEEMVIAIREKKSGVLSIGDFGGTAAYWDQVYDMARNPLNLEITLINQSQTRETDSRFNHLLADVRELAHISNHAFDVSFSNSLIEHLGDLSVQARVVKEMLRIGSHVYLQTPNRGFFWEPHYALPFVHWLSLPARMRTLSMVSKTSLRKQYDVYISNPVRLLSKSELRYIFPQSEFDHQAERAFGTVKSWVIRSRSALMLSHLNDR